MFQCAAIFSCNQAVATTAGAPDIDWALNKEAAAKKGMPAPRQVPEEQLKPKLEPTAVPGRRISHLDSMEHKGDPLEHKGSEGAQ
eukprot:scaffold186991_cov15-Tisochrysis_lutea.AAC.1